MAQAELTRQILRLSESNSWVRAKSEWRLDEVYQQDEPSTCLCGHFPIREVCVLRNAHNGNTAEVGNVCVKKFLGLPSDKIFRALHRIAADPEKALNPEAINHAHGRGWINDWERTFYLDTWRTRKLTSSQLSKRREINRLVLRRSRRGNTP